jgi:hypothetical protein
MAQIEDVTTTQLAEAIQAASEEVLAAWQPEHGPVRSEFYRQVALRTQGHLRRTGAMGQIPAGDADRIRQALHRIEVNNPCAGSMT